MRTEKHRRPLWRAAAALALCAAMGSGVVVAPAPARAADTVRGLQWHLDALKIPQAHKLSRGRGVVVAVIDSGVYANHPDLKGQVLPGHGIGSDAAPDGRSDPNRQNGHGTAMAGIIAGRGGGEMRSLGIAPEAKILPLGLGVEIRDDEAAIAIRWAVDHGAKVINLSFGSDAAEDPRLLEAVRYAQSKDAVLVAGVGNIEETGRKVISPARLPGVVAVSAFTRSGSLWSGSATGPEVVLAAPGARIIAPAPPTVSPNGYTVNDGTSDATAMVSGIVALIRARYPDADAANVINRLIRTVRDEGPSGRDPEFGFGAVDVLAALTGSVPTVQANPLVNSAEPGAASTRTADADDDGPAVTFTVKNKTGTIVAAGLCLLVVLVVVVLVVVAVRRRASRRRPLAGGTTWPPGGMPPPGPPGGFAPPGPPGGFPPPTPTGGFPPAGAPGGFPPSGFGGPPPPGLAAPVPPGPPPTVPHPHQPRPLSYPHQTPPAGPPGQPPTDGRPAPPTDPSTHRQ